MRQSLYGWIMQGCESNPEAIEKKLSGMTLYLDIDNGGFSKIRGTFLEIPIIRIVMYWGPLILGNCQLGHCNSTMPAPWGGGQASPKS